MRSLRQIGFISHHNEPRMAVQGKGMAGSMPMDRKSFWWQLGALIG